MKTLKHCFIMTMLLAVACTIGCKRSATQSPDVADNVRKSLDQAGLKGVSVSQNRDKGVVTLSGNVPSDSDKEHAQSIASSIANGQVVANEIAVVPPGGNRDIKSENSDLDSAIGKNLDAALLQNHLHRAVSYKVKNGVVTLTGEVNSEARRAQAEKVASSIPNVQQVVNELQVRGRKATSSAGPQG